MIKKDLLSATLTLLTLSFPAAASPITDFADARLAGASLLDFDAYTGNGYLNDFEAGIVNFHDDNPFSGNYFAQDAHQPGMSGRMIGLYGEARITFDVAVSAVAFSISAFNSDWTMQTLDQAGDVLETIALDKPVGSFPVVRGAGGYDFWGVQLFDSGSPMDITTMDNLTYAASSVDEPSALSLLALSGILIAFSHWNNRRR